MNEQKIREIIEQLKEIRKAKGLTIQRIFEMVQETGEYVSPATIKRIFAEGSEERNFRYEDSIKPIMIALVGKDIVEPPEGHTMSIAEQEANALRAVAALKEDMIQELKDENKRIKEDLDVRLKYVKDESDRKTQHIADLTRQTEKKDKSIFWLTFIIIALSLLIITALIVDRINPDLGYFWRSMSAIVSGNSQMRGAGYSNNVGNVLSCLVWR